MAKSREMAHPPTGRRRGIGTIDAEQTLTITQRNVNRSFSLLKRLATIRNFGALIDLEVAYWPDRCFALTGQIEEFSRLSAKALLDTLDAMTLTGKDEAPRGDEPLGAKIIRTLAPCEL